MVLTTFQACTYSHGCMNNITFNDNTFGYYENIVGGCHARISWSGTSEVQCHMKNTHMKYPNSLEKQSLVLLYRFVLMTNGGGVGQYKEGDGITQEIEYNCPLAWYSLKL